jgi:hypothetical protein
LAGPAANSTSALSALQIHGRNLSADDLLGLQTAGGIEADRATRLWALWYQQKFLVDKIDVRLGQMSLDQEFMVSKEAAYFVNTSFRLADLAVFRYARRRPRLSAIGPRRARRAASLGNAAVWAKAPAADSAAALTLSAAFRMNRMEPVEKCRDRPQLVKPLAEAIYLGERSAAAGAHCDFYIFRRNDGGMLPNVHGAHKRSTMNVTAALRPSATQHEGTRARIHHHAV